MSIPSISSGPGFNHDRVDISCDIKRLTTFELKPRPHYDGFIGGFMEHANRTAIDFDLIDLRLFVNVCKDNSLTHGAERSHISLPAASKRIKNIEDKLGTKLIFRSNKGLTLTSAGKVFLRHGRLFLKQLECLHSDLQGHPDNVKERLRILANCSSLEFLLPYLRIYMASHPNVTVDLNERRSPEIVPAVAEGSADIGVVAGDNMCDEDLHYTLLERVDLALVTSATHPLAERKTISFRETWKCDYVSRQHLIDRLVEFNYANREALSDTPNIRMRANDTETVCRMFEANVGISLLPESAARRYARDMKIRLVRLSDSWRTRNLYLCVRKNGSFPLFVREFIRLLVNGRASLGC